MDDSGDRPRTYVVGSLADETDLVGLVRRYERNAEDTRTRFDVLGEKLDRLITLFETAVDDLAARITKLEQNGIRRLRAGKK